MVKIYADAIQFVNDQTVRLMGADFGFNEHGIVDEVQKLFKNNEQLWNPVGFVGNIGFKELVKEYLSESYGLMEWSIKGIIHNKVGWFDGNSKNLKDYSNKNQKWLDSLGGFEKLKTRILKLDLKKTTMNENEINDLLHTLDLLEYAENDEHPAKAFKNPKQKEILIKISESTKNPTLRNYFLTMGLNVDVELLASTSKKNIQCAE